MSDNLFKLHSVFNKVAVTAISFWNSLLFTGIAGDLLVFDSSNKYTLVKKLNILDSHTIHGFLINKEKNILCSFGEKFIVVSKLDFDSSKPLQVRCIHKWRVKDWVLCCGWLGSSQLAALTAHNQLILFNSHTGGETSSVTSTEKCILYCGTIIARGEKWTDVVVIAGTVFQQVIIWSVTDSSTGDRQLLHKLQGHKGVIFSVCFDNRSRQILSTSDDRSVRVWSVKSSGNLLSADDWKNASISLAYSVFGHTSRVWQSYCLQNENLVSIGEDSMLCVWRKGGECESRRETHQGGGVWCMVVNEELGIVVTGGADGGISVWPLECTVSLESLPAPPQVPRQTKLLSCHELLVTTESGHLLSHSGNSWRTVYSDCKFSNYCLLETSPSRQLIALASIRGDIVILNSTFEILLEEKISNDRIYSVHWLDNDSFLTCHDHGDIFIWKMKNSGELGKVQQLSLPACKERWTTAAVSCGSVVVFGDRMGNIHSAPLHRSTVTETCTIGRAHSRLGVCSLSVSEGRVWSTGRDGTIKQFTLTDHCLTLVLSSKLPLDWAATLIHSPLFGLVALCFHETSLVLWSVKERRQLTSVQCGGGHRSWSFFLDNYNLSFAFLKSKTAHKLVCPVDLISRPNILEGFHVREVNCMSRLSGRQSEDVWLLSGGEDGSVRLTRYNTTENSWLTCCTEYSHVSSVRSVTSCTLDNHTLVFSAGGRAQLKVWKVHFDDSGCTLMELSSVMLRDERRGQHWLNSVPVSDPETRYMDLDIAILSHSSLCLLAACSDAFLRIFYYDLIRNSVELHSSVKHSENCLLRVKSFTWPDGRAGAVTTGTDGHLVFWDLDVQAQAGVTPVLRQQLHQSGVNAISVTHIQASDKLLVVTGGDDNALQVTGYQLSTTPSLAVHKFVSWSSSTLHSSVITGVEVVGDRIMCSGGDQRVTQLSWQLTGNDLSVQVLGQYCCSVPDIKGLTILNTLSNNIFICLYGVGAEILELKREKR